MSNATTKYCYLCNRAMQAFAYVCQQCQHTNGGKYYRLVIDIATLHRLQTRTSPSDSYYEFQQYKIDADLQVDEGL